MIDRLPPRVVVLGIVGFVVVLGTLGAISSERVTSVPAYLAALLLGLLAVVAVLLPWPPGRQRLGAVGVTVAVVALGLVVVSVLEPGRPGYALWYPAFVWVPLCGIALRGHAVLALVGAGLSAATTIAWASADPAVGLEEGLYRVVSPTAVVVVSVGVALLVQQYSTEVGRARAEQMEAARLSAGARAAETERRHRLHHVEQLAAPVLEQLRRGVVDDRLRAQCRLLEAALRDGIRGRHLVDAAVRETLWAARSRGVEVTLLDDSGTDVDEQPPPVAALVRRCTVQLVEKLEDGVVTVRLSGPAEATLVALTPAAAEVATACGEAMAVHGDLFTGVEVGWSADAPDELVVTVRRDAPAPTAPRAAPDATAARPA